MENYIVRIENQEEWKKVVAKALAVGFKWPGGGDIEEDTYSNLLEDEEDVFLFLNGTENLDNEYTDPMTIQWDTMISTDEDYNYDHYKEVSADELLEDEDTVKNYIVTVASRKQWKKVAKKAINLGYIWPDGDTKANSHIYDSWGNSVYYLFLHGTKNLDSKNRSKMQLAFSSRSEVGDEAYAKYERLDAKEFLYEEPTLVISQEGSIYRGPNKERIATTDKTISMSTAGDIKVGNAPTTTDERIAVKVSSVGSWVNLVTSAISVGYTWQDGSTEVRSSWFNIHKNVDAGKDIYMLFNTGEGTIKAGALPPKLEAEKEEGKLETMTEEEFIKFIKNAQDEEVNQPIKGTNPDDFKHAILVKSEEEWEAVFEKVVMHGGAWQDGDKESSSDKYDEVHENLGSGVVLILNAKGLLSIGSLEAIEDVGLTENIKTVTADEFLNSDLERFENVDPSPRKKRVFLVPIGSPEDRDKVTEKAKKDNWEPFVSERVVDEIEALQRAATYIGFYYDTAGEGVRSYLTLDDGAADMFRDKYGKDVVEDVPLDSFLAMEEDDTVDDEDEFVQALVSLFEQFKKKDGNND